MSILDTFYILFKTDADKAAEDIKKVDDASDQAEDGLKKVDKAATGVGSSFVAMARNLAAPLLTLGTLSTLLSVAVGRAAAVRELDQFSSKLNASISDVDAFQRTVKGMGGETAAALDSLVKISEKVNEAFSDAESGARKDFDAWGLAFKNTKGEALGASDAMLQLAGNLEDVSRAEALARIKKLGIEDAATIDMLLKGRRALEERIRAEKELGVVTEEQARLTREYYGEMGRAQNGLTSLGNAILETFLPAVSLAVRGFANLVDWMARNKTLVSGFFIGIAGVITAVFLPALTSLATAVVAATWPFLAIGGVILAVGAAFALAYEDIVAFMNGQPSLIGALAERYEWFGKIVTGIVNIFPTLREAATSAINGIKSASDTFFSSNGWQEFAAGIQRDTKTIREALEPVANKFREMQETIEGFAADSWSDFVTDMTRLFEKLTAALRPVVTAFNAAKKAIMDFFGAAASQPASAYGGGNVPAGMVAPLGMGGMTFPSGVAAGQAALNSASGAPINGQTPQSIAGAPTVNQNSNVSVGSVTVNTQATDAKGVAAAVKGELTKQLRNTSAQFDDGVAK